MYVLPDPVSTGEKGREMVYMYSCKFHFDIQTWHCLASMTKKKANGHLA